MDFRITDLASTIPTIVQQAATGSLRFEPGLATGYQDFDKRIGGLHRGELILLGGRPGMGCSAWALGAALHAAYDTSDAGSVAISTCLQEPNVVAQRLASSFAKVPYRSLTQGEIPPSERRHLHEAAGRLEQEGRVFLLDPIRMSTSQIRSQLEHLNSHSPDRRIRLLIVDSLTMMLGGESTTTRAMEIENIARELKLIALEFGISIISTIALPSSVDRRIDSRPRMSDLRSFGSIDAIADIVAFLFRPEYYLGDETPVEWQGKADLIVAKATNRAPGNSILGFLGAYMKFVNLTPPPDPASHPSK